MPNGSNGKNGTALRWLGFAVTVGLIIGSIALSYGALSAETQALATNQKETKAAAEAIGTRAQQNTAAIQVLQAELRNLRAELVEIKTEQRCLRQGQDEIKDLIRGTQP